MNELRVFTALASFAIATSALAQTATPTAVTCNNLTQSGAILVSQSSTLSDGACGSPCPAGQCCGLLATDDDTTGTFSSGSVSHTGYDSEAWIEIDLGRLAEISQIQVYNRTDCCGTRFGGHASPDHILVSDSAFGGTSLAARQATSGVLDISVSSPPDSPSQYDVSRTGQYIALQIDASDYLNFAEIKICGTDFTPTPTGTVTLTPAVTPTQTITPTQTVPPAPTRRRIGPQIMF